MDRGSGIEITLTNPEQALAEQHGRDFNGKLHDERLNMKWFRNRTEARIVMKIGASTTHRQVALQWAIQRRSRSLRSLRQDITNRS